MTREQELYCFSLADDIFRNARELSAKYNAVLQVVKMCGEELVGITYEEFKEWLDKTLNAMNESWNAQYDAFNEGKSEEEIKKVGRDHAMKELGRFFEDD